MSTVLVVEANESIIILLETMLARANHQVLSARSGALGIEMAETYQPDLILIDEHLPGMAGEVVCAQLRSNPATSHIPLILSTTASVGDPLHYAQRTGADYVLPKPFRAQDLLSLLDCVLHP
ncbi:MAG: hypothetical protein CL610_13130 [Anaerolineaceae bacterium]|nr:hypothetical protein [Anaerolineaceae bacterium]